MNTDQTAYRTIGLDCHPDSFTAALLDGLTPAQAVVQKIFDKVPIAQLQKWAKKHTLPTDLILLEASGNSFQVVRNLKALDRKALVLESCTLGKLKEAHANNDKISAVRIAKAYLAGTAKIVWVPDLKTQERRDCFHAYQKACKRTTQTRNRVLSYLSDNDVRLIKGTQLAKDQAAEQQIKKAKNWSSPQWSLLKIYLADLRHAESQRRLLRSLIAQEVLNDPCLLQLVRLCGVREIVAFALGAFVGDISRFASPGSLVKYIGLNPAFNDSGKNQWHAGIGGHGHKDLRCLLIEAAQSIMRSKNQALGKWGRKLLARKGTLNLAAAAVARKLTVAIWYLMMGKWTTLEEIDKSLSVKIGTIINALGRQTLGRSGKTSKNYREEIYALLLAGKHVYLLEHPAPKKST